MIDLEQQWLDEIIAILRRHAPQCEAWAFGSRVRGKAEQHADLDVVLVGPEPLPWEDLEALKEGFAESDLPVIVDVHDWQAIPEDSQRRISEEHEVLKQAEMAKGS